MELYDGRPDSTDGRLPREIRTYDFLDSLGMRMCLKERSLDVIHVYARQV